MTVLTNTAGRYPSIVLTSVQDLRSTNNATFATPSYSQSGTCRMSFWSAPIIHKFTHKIIDWLNGGGTGRRLQTTESREMDEVTNAIPGWTEHKDSTVWVFNNIAQSIHTLTQPTRPSIQLRYSSVQQLHEVHADVGEVWANMLHNVYAALVEAHGFSSTAMDDPSGTEGNVVCLHLFIDALSLLPCNFTLPNARDVWIQADQNWYDRTNACTLWNAFASQGLGIM
ncbi:peptidase M36 [Armillaria borealis]|uniref:Extracellular metalloproteinase n=1 Tax=Armillaria borealis TaxID=47425 RepID=A0AA39ITV8_9AGAR|nr:peptidase M36 [Armillaria borealis]